MALIKFNNRSFPWFNNELSSWIDSDLFDEELFSNGNGKKIPAMNIKENKNDFEVELSVPGFQKKEIEIALENDQLIVSAEKSAKDIQENENGYTRKEFSYNAFERRMKLPESVDAKKDVKANYDNGILKLKLHKKEAAKIPPKKMIQIA
ncbi:MULTISPECIES: Hsp20/alpha crystallin family protein [Aequorivita]|uniref:Hsp20/alpha crystallin family protein n=1 Tax=Aequorivita iocasae TaxID=2803865 RepID=A0ABX7DQY7_9FLAO|nr:MULTISPECIES: Hsp20/alpha crystallin family protein [Aequorivita]QQX76177.1 Hsp20/alpha crystallin family protein [Aequorivita iocasae]UCA55637.1 Hsp20/alpha crystallin family protein [Aequorivita sp. F7]